MLRPLLTLGLPALLAPAALSQTIAGDAHRAPAPVYAGKIDAATGAIAPPARSGVIDTLYANNTFIGSFYALDPGEVLVDEGRLPSTTSPDVVGTFDSYTLEELEIGYATDAADPSVGGTGVRLRVSIFDSYAACAPLEAAPAPLLEVEFDGPGSTTGGVQAFVLDLDVSALGLCMRADGDGVNDGMGDLFGWSFEVVDPGTGGTVGTGPLFGADPLNAPEGDGTAYQNPAAMSGSGLGTRDLVRVSSPSDDRCIFFGGYPANLFASFWMVVRGDSTAGGDCIGCGLGDDRFEENDTPASATPVAFDAYLGLVCDAEDDWYSITIEPGEGLQVDLLFSTSTADLDVYLFDAATMVELDRGFTGTDDEQVTYSNCTASPVDVLVQVDSFSGNCGGYDMVVSDPAALDDAFEPNDTCLEAAPLPLGTTRGLVVRRTCQPDNDVFGVTLADGETLTIDVLFDGTVDDINIALNDVSSIACPGVAVAASLGSGSREHITYTNTSGASIDLALTVGLVTGEFRSYDLVAKVTPSITLGELICIGNPNSETDGASLCTTGSPFVSDNDVNFDVTGLPLNIFGFFVVSKEIGFVNPIDSEGTLCIASNSIGRYDEDILGSGAMGEFSFSPDLGQIPFAAGGQAFFISAMAGDTLNFQAWYRDTNSMGNTSNFTDAVTITFQ